MIVLAQDNLKLKHVTFKMAANITPALCKIIYISLGLLYILTILNCRYYLLLISPITYPPDIVQKINVMSAMGDLYYSFGLYLRGCAQKGPPFFNFTHFFLTATCHHLR